MGYDGPLTSEQQCSSYLFFRKEVIQPHLPIRLPCYDFTPVTRSAFDCCLPLDRTSLFLQGLRPSAGRIFFTSVAEHAPQPSLPGCSSVRGVGTQASGVPDSHGVTGGVYKTRERIHRGILIRDY